MANVNIRVDDTVKRDVETIFSELGLSMSAATNIFYKQVIRTGGVPFELKLQPLPRKEGALDFSRMTQEKIDAELQKGWDSARAGRTVPADEVRKKMEARFNNR